MKYIVIASLMLSVNAFAFVDMNGDGSYHVDQWGSAIELSKAPHNINRPRVWDEVDSFVNIDIPLAE